MVRLAVEMSLLSLYLELAAWSALSQMGGYVDNRGTLLIEGTGWEACRIIVTKERRWQMSGPTEKKPYVTTSVRADVRKIASCLNYFIREQGVYPTSFAQLFERCVSTLYDVVQQAHPELIIADVHDAYEFYKANVGNVPVRGERKLLTALATIATAKEAPSMVDSCLEDMAAMQARQLERCVPAETPIVDEDDEEIIDSAVNQFIGD